MSAPAVRSMEHTGDSANVAYYSERGRSGNYLKVEMMRTVSRRTNRTIFYLTISRHDVGQLLPTLRYIPRRTPRPGPLPAATITRILRQFEAEDLADPAGGERR